MTLPDMDDAMAQLQKMKAAREAQEHAARWAGGGLRCVRCGDRHASREVGGSWVCSACDPRKDAAPQGVTPSTAYARQLAAQAPHPRTFTREEVLAVLKTQLATHGTNPAYEIRHLITVFERME